MVLSSGWARAALVCAALALGGFGAGVLASPAPAPASASALGPARIAAAPIEARIQAPIRPTVAPVGTAVSVPACAACANTAALPAAPDPAFPIRGASFYPARGPGLFTLSDATPVSESPVPGIGALLPWLGLLVTGFAMGASAFLVPARLRPRP